MIRCVVKDNCDVVSLTTSQFIEGVNKGKVISFHVEDYGMLTEDGRLLGYYCMKIRGIKFYINTGFGECFWNRDINPVQKAEMKRSAKLLERPKIDDIFKDMGIK
ncbi:unnamed protein product [marine sediment metagenome]|uniref:Uncharacterized protein n=1 Tax=marine sediment metagenome TaxID=412755 RepID=X0T7D7_9ZZZZ